MDHVGGGLRAPSSLALPNAASSRPFSLTYTFVTMLCTQIPCARHAHAQQDQQHKAAGHGSALLCAAPSCCDFQSLLSQIWACCILLVFWPVIFVTTSLFLRGPESVLWLWARARAVFSFCCFRLAWIDKSQKKSQKHQNRCASASLIGGFRRSWMIIEVS
jgi:hypothetical protein